MSSLKNVLLIQERKKEKRRVAKAEGYRIQDLEWRDGYLYHKGVLLDVKRLSKSGGATDPYTEKKYAEEEKKSNRPSPYKNRESSTLH